MMLLERPFTAVTPTADGDVLEVLAGAEASFTTSQLHAVLGEYSYNGVRKVLERLVGQGIVRSERYGNTDVFRLNRDHLAARPILELASLRSTFIRRTRSLIDQWTTSVEFAALFGSAARGHMTLDSDIDIFIVRPREVLDDEPVWLEQVDHLQQQIAIWTGNDARPLEYSLDDVLDCWGRDGVLESIHAEGVRLAGPRDFWRKVRHGEQDW